MVQKFKDVLSDVAKETRLQFGYLDEVLEPRDITRKQPHLMFWFPHTNERLISVIPQNMVRHLNKRLHAEIISRTLGVENISWKDSKKSVDEEKAAASVWRFQQHFLKSFFPF